MEAKLINANNCMDELMCRIANQSGLIVSIAGLSRSGKSSFVNQLQQRLRDINISSVAISLDDWILPVNIRKTGMTVQERFPYPQISADLDRLMSQKEISIYPYESKTRLLATEKKIISIHGSQCVLIDGVIALDHPMIREISDFCIYIEVDENVRKQRFLDFYQYKGLSEKEIITLYAERSKEESILVLNSKVNADFIIKY